MLVGVVLPFLLLLLLFLVSFLDVRSLARVSWLPFSFFFFLPC